MAGIRRSGLILRQLFDGESCTFTYIIGCAATKKAIIIDPVDTKVSRDAKLIQELKLNLEYAVNTHVHADHITGSGFLKALLGCKTVISEASKAKSDVHLKDGEILTFGEKEIEARATPGHTHGCMTFVDHSARAAFTGDSLLIRACGRTDFQQGDATTLYNSIHNKIFNLPEDYLLFPGHDYRGMSVTTVAEEKEFNPRLTHSLEDFTFIMSTLGLAAPKKIDQSIPMNMLDGILEKGKQDGHMQEADQSGPKQHGNH
ncbi:persulfide dioxygenase ETHE1, mitochondrial [Exaiptasia diaphana]|uniref:Persulfide dioxygenase ETHE1, mitochondrial n=1 Tax=Exaiptasia diaphana TaxID=2652724 RepID=A0A913XAD0_EXADI|nr:persulfide dioxygenase ETHE1, mitochondrial [Exaiptasia diaphana]KXJ26618.1 Persulfide dioxygenase ETHE1, mitochondrial [Exaiptasia diaphana]